MMYRGYKLSEFNEMEEINGVGRLFVNKDGFIWRPTNELEYSEIEIGPDFKSTGLYNEVLDEIGERINVEKRFPGDRLSFYIGDYDIWSPFEKLKGYGNCGIIYDYVDGYYQPIVLILNEINVVEKVTTLNLYCKDLMTLRLYVNKNQVEITNWAIHREYSLTTYIAGMGCQEDESRAQKRYEILNVIPD